jgi:hypothetical protein
MPDPDLRKSLTGHMSLPREKETGMNEGGQIHNPDCDILNNVKQS